MKVLVFFLLCFSLSARPCDDGLVKDNDLQIPPDSVLANDMTESEFNRVIKNFEKHFGPGIEEDHKAELIVYHSWGSNTVNAYADRKPRKIEITIFGGLARHKAITSDGLALTLCHELGHHFGGYPKKSTNRWSSAEGQADYYSTTKCLRRLWAEDNNFLYLKSVPERVWKECKQSYFTNSEVALCARISMAGKSVALMFQDLEHDSIEPKFDTPDTYVTRVLNYMHPYAQCRLDTYFQGAICPAQQNEEFDNEDEVTGSCHPRLGDIRGLRPLCWFVSR